MSTSQPLPGWYLDPTGLSDGRFWDGDGWTEVVTRTGVTATAPIDPTRAAVPPLPGTAIVPPVTRSSIATENDRAAVALGLGVIVAALVVVLLIFAVGNQASDQTPPSVTDPPATASPVSNPGNGG